MTRRKKPIRRHAATTKKGRSTSRSNAKRPLARARRGAPQSSGSLRLGLVIAALVGINLYVFLWRSDTSIPEVMEKAAVAGEEGPLVAKPAAAPAEALPDDPEEAAELEKLREAELRIVAGEVAAGDSMGLILRRHGLEAASADELIRALSGKLDFRSIRAGQSFKLYFDDATNKLMKFEFDVSRTTRVRAKREPDDSLSAEVIDAHTEVRQESIGGEIEGSLFRSMKRSGEDTSLVSFFVDVFAYDLNFYIDTHPGDTYRIVVEKEYLEDEFIGYGKVLAAEYSGNAGTYRAFWWQEPGKDEGKYFDDKGQSLEKTFLKTPLKFARVSSGFNPSRMHPVLHVRKGHWGTDYAAPPGTPIWSAAPGKITYRGRRGGAGNCVIVNHDNGLQTVYMHMSKFRSGQKVGTRVRAKDVIGYVGSTGLATGPHLHFGVKKNGHYIDPQKMKMTRGVGVAKKHLAQFQADTANWVASLSEISTEAPPANPFIVRL